MTSRYEFRSYVIEPHWHVCFGRGTSTLVYAKTKEDIGEWLKRLAITDPEPFFSGVSPDVFTAIFCEKDDCKPRPRSLGTMDEFLRHRVHGWWRFLGLDDLV